MILRPAKILGELSPQVQKLAPHFIGQCLNGVCLSGLSVFVCLGYLSFCLFVHLSVSLLVCLPIHPLVVYMYM